jgi:hypothetical protein
MKTELTENEQQYADEKDALMHETIKNCSMLYKMAEKPCSETCMCWLWSCGYGWFDVLEKLSNKLEAINLMIYPKYRVRIQAEQVKEKFSTLRFYYSIVIDPPWYIRWYENLMEFTFNMISKLDFGSINRVLLEEGFDKIEEKTFDTKDEFEDERKRYKGVTNVSFEEIDGKFIMKTKYWHSPKYKMVSTKHKFLYQLYEKRYSIMHFMSSLVDWMPSTEQNIIQSSIYDTVDKLIRDAEIECSNYCETCGRRIGTKYSPTCTTRGWIKQICKECADKIDCEYVSEGKIWKSGEIIGEVKKFND